MSRPALRIFAVTLTTLIIVVLVSALDHLPNTVQKQIDSERNAFSSAQGQLNAAQIAVTRETQSHPLLFEALAASRQWPRLFQQASGTLHSAARDLDELSQLEKHGHYRDRDHAEHLLADERGLRAAALGQASAIQTEAAHWLFRKQQLPAELQQMDRDYQSVHNFDLTPLVATIERAETDWPGKKADLEARLGSVRGIVSHLDVLWQSTAAGRR